MMYKKRIGLQMPAYIHWLYFLALLHVFRIEGQIVVMEVCGRICWWRTHL